MAAIAAMHVACGRIAFDHVPSGASPGPDGVVPPSCAGLPATCGSGGVDSCCASAPVAGASYFRSYDVANDNAFASRSNPATVSDFVLDRYEITVNPVG